MEGYRDLRVAKLIVSKEHFKVHGPFHVHDVCL